jgi:YidC/Oxa1 family membrane protein insertase
VNQRIMLFLFVAMGLLLFNALSNRQDPQEKDKQDQEAKDAEKDAEKDPDKDTPKDADGKAEKTDPEEAETPKKPLVQEKPREARRLTLGSFDPESGYSMLVTLTTKGAAIERVELSSEKYRDIDDHNGYLGNLALSDSNAERGPGCIVGVVGRGTPAHVVGFKVGDLITAVDGVAVGGKTPYLTAMSGTKPGQQITLTVKRAAAQSAPAEELTFDILLVRRPLEVCRPEIENYNFRDEELPEKFADHPSLLLTLQDINGNNLGTDEGELPGLDLRDGHWEVLDGESESEVQFQRVITRHKIQIIKRYRLEKSESEDDEKADEDSKEDKAEDEAEEKPEESKEESEDEEKSEDKSEDDEDSKEEKADE